MSESLRELNIKEKGRKKMPQESNQYILHGSHFDWHLYPSIEAALFKIKKEKKNIK